MTSNAWSIRARFTLWCLSVCGVILLLYGVGISYLFAWQLQRQLRIHAVEDIETVEGLLFLTPDGKVMLNESYHNHPQSRLVEQRLLEVWSDSGRILFKNDKLGSRSLGGPPSTDEGLGGYSERHGRLQDGTPVTLVSRRHILDGHPLLMRLAYSEESIWQRFRQLVIAMLIGLPLALGLGGAVGYLLADRALAPIGEMVRRAERISLQNLSTRLPVDHDDELGYLARVFNEMLARLEQSFEQLRRFTADASHELRTPLAAIRSVGEVGLQKDGGREEYRDTIGNMLEETNHLTQLVEGLLTLSRADAGQIQLRSDTIAIMSVLRESAALVEVLAEERQQCLILEGDENAQILGDVLFLRQAIVNVLHNAIKYSSTGGTILASVHFDEQRWLVISIKDSGPGIPPEHREKVFERFYRIDQARGRESGGAGLGLAIVKWAVQAHGGEVHVASAPDGGGIFSFRLPCARDTALVARPA